MSIQVLKISNSPKKTFFSFPLVAMVTNMNAPQPQTVLQIKGSNQPPNESTNDGCKKDVSKIFKKR